MTGEKNRFTTQEKLWKLDDETLSTPKHDEMVLWLLNKENILILFPEYKEISKEKMRLVDAFKHKEYTFDDAYQILQEMNHTPIREALADAICKVFTFKEFGLSTSLKIESEVPISAPNKFLVGYWDIICKVDINNISSIIPHGVNGSYFPELIYDGVLYSEHNIFKPKYIEVKPKIKSFGETLRQLKTYQNYVPEAIGRTYLFTADMGFKGAFESQGIKVIEYDAK